MIFFPGDKVRATRYGYYVTGVIEAITYDVPAILRGSCEDAAIVRVSSDAGPYRSGGLIAIPVAELQAVA